MVECKPSVTYRLQTQSGGCIREWDWRQYLKPIAGSRCMTEELKNKHSELDERIERIRGFL